MRVLNRNTRYFYACEFLGIQPFKDSNGNLTGEKIYTYGQPIKFRGNISAARGRLDEELFGINSDHERVIIMDDPKCPIDTAWVLFIDKEPEFKGTTPFYNYVLSKPPARSINSIAYAIKSVSVS